jgi:hypothetical protein
MNLTLIDRQHRSSALGGRFVASALPFALAALLLGACSGGKKTTASDASASDAGVTADASDAGAPPPATAVGIDAVPVGACGAPASADVYVSAFVATDCRSPHAMEVAGRYTLADPVYPGHTRLHLDSYRDCQPIFEAYVGVPSWNSRYDIQTITPSPSTWARGDRGVTCLIVAEDGTPLSVPVRNTRR